MKIDRKRLEATIHELGRIGEHLSSRGQALRVGA